jgi:hypothetical protein
LRPVRHDPVLRKAYRYHDPTWTPATETRMLIPQESVRAIVDS